MDKKIRDIKKLSPQQRCFAAMTVAISPLLNGRMTGMTVEVRGSKGTVDVEVDPIVVSGEIGLIRPHLHSILDEIIDKYEVLSSAEPDVRTTDKPRVWSPQDKEKKD